MKHVRIIISLLSLICLGVFTSCEPVTYDTFGDISGFVVDFETGEPVVNANITLSPSGLPAHTGSDGYFQILNLESGQYDLIVRSSGYKTEKKTVNVIPGEIIQITLTLRK